MQLADTDDLALWYALNRLMTNYWADVDGNSGSQAHEFYLSDALYAVGANRFEGQQNIRAFYDRRRQRGSTTSRHLIDNLRVFRDDARRARMFGVMSLYLADGRPPIEKSTPPAMIAVAAIDLSGITACRSVSAASTDHASRGNREELARVARNTPTCLACRFNRTHRRRRQPNDQTIPCECA